MEEEYLLNKMIKGKTEKEREIELMQNIIETKEICKMLEKILNMQKMA